MKLVAMSAEQARILDEVVVPLLMRSRKDEQASHMMALSLAYIFADEPEPKQPSNVVQFDAYSRRVTA